jgi:monoamine oxidase
MGSVIKFNVLYDRPFWRDEGLSGHVSSPDLPLSVVLDNVPHGSQHGVLLAFAEGRHARQLSALTVGDRRAVALDCLATYFGPRAAQALEFLEKDWSAEPFSGGCYGGRLGTGVWTAYGPQLRQPVGLIHWAGTETSAVWNGYMDGAVRSGHRAAVEISQALSFTESR